LRGDFCQGVLDALGGLLPSRDERHAMVSENLIFLERLNRLVDPVNFGEIRLDDLDQLIVRSIPGEQVDLVHEVGLQELQPGRLDSAIILVGEDLGCPCPGRLAGQSERAGEGGFNQITPSDQDVSGAGFLCQLPDEVVAGLANELL